MKTFIKDSVDLIKMNTEFAKKHWKGMLAVNAAVVVGEFAWIMKEPIKDALKEKMSKKNKIEVKIDDEVLCGEMEES